MSEENPTQYWIVIKCTQKAKPLRCGNGTFKQHKNLASAYTEMKRLSEDNPGFYFAVFEHLGSMRTEKIKSVDAEEKKEVS